MIEGEKRELGSGGINKAENDTIAKDHSIMSFIRLNCSTYCIHVLNASNPTSILNLYQTRKAKCSLAFSSYSPPSSSSSFHLPSRNRHPMSSQSSNNSNNNCCTPSAITTLTPMVLSPKRRCSPSLKRTSRASKPSPMP